MIEAAILAGLSHWNVWVPSVTLTAAGLYLIFFKNESSGQLKRAFFLKQFIGMCALLGAIYIPLAAPHETLVWELYEPPLLEEIRYLEQPVIVDFFADWCLPCLEMEQFTYSDPKVIRSLEGFRKVQVDASDPEAPALKLLAERFNVEGLPSILFVGADGMELREARITGFVTPKDFLMIVNSPKVQHLLTGTAKPLDKD